MEESGSFIGYIEYHGDLVSEGLMDARKAARALVGFDSAVRYFAGVHNPELKDVEFELPVLIKKGSWQAVIPDDAIKYILAVLGIAGTAYLATAATELAKNDFKNASLRKALEKALMSIQWLVRLGKHLGTTRQKQFEKVQWREANTLIGIPDSEGKLLFLPKSHLDMIVQAPPKLISEMASLVVPGRSLRLVAKTETTVEIETITPEVRSIFYVPESEADTLFPALAHGQSILLEGVMTRGNENTNSMGLRYQDHILNCVPNEGSIVRFKKALFLKSRITGTISRADAEGVVNQKKPVIVFTNIEPLEEEPPALLLPYNEA